MIVLVFMNIMRWVKGLVGNVENMTSPDVARLEGRSFGDLGDVQGPEDQ